MQVARVTLKDGFVYYDDKSEGFHDRVRNLQANRHTGLDVVDILEMTEAEYIAIGTSSEIHALLQPPVSEEGSL